MGQEAALRLARQGIVENSEPESWHSHMLRHSFKSEGEHAKVPSALVEYFMDHTAGISWVYDNRDQVHQEDFVEAYLKLEPHVSLDYTETTLREQYDGREKMLLSKVLELERNYEALKKELLSGARP